MTLRTRWPLWLAAAFVAALAAPWWWPSSGNEGVPAQMPPITTLTSTPIAAVPAPAVHPPPMPAPARPSDAALSAPALKLVGTVMAGNSANSFALMRRTADAQLVQLHVGSQVDGLTVSVIGSDSVVLDGTGQSVVIEADGATASPQPSPAARPAPVPDVEPAWAGDPAPFGH